MKNEMKAWWIDEDGVFNVNACCDAANDDWIRAGRLKDKARKGDTEAQAELDRLEATPMIGETVTRLAYMIDYFLKDYRAAVPEYVPCGVWVANGSMLKVFYLPAGPAGLDGCRADADAVLARLKAENITELPVDFLEAHRLRRSPYRGAFSEPVVTEEYSSLAECGKAILDSLQIGPKSDR